MKLNLSQQNPFFVVSWYRPPSDLTETFDKFEDVLKCLESEGKEIILLGDTNCDVTSIYSPQIDSNQSLPNSTKRILDLYNSFGLKQLISEPTRETIDTSSTGMARPGVLGGAGAPPKIH